MGEGGGGQKRTNASFVLLARIKTATRPSTQKIYAAKIPMTAPSLEFISRRVNGLEGQKADWKRGRKRERREEEEVRNSQRNDDHSLVRVEAGRTDISDGGGT